MAFSSGLPYLLVGQILKGMLTRSGVELATVGLFAWVRYPYSFKFLWAPLMDRFQPFGFGRRRDWLLITQVGLALALAGLAFVMHGVHLVWIAILATLVAFCSASQDIVIDAYRREILPDAELGLGSSLYLFGYRMGILFSSTLCFYLADLVSWQFAYWAMAGSVVVGLLITWFAPEPEMEAPPPRNLKESVVDPLIEFFRRDGAWLILAFIFFYKIGESLASEMYIPFYMKMGFSNSEIGTGVRFIGMSTMIAGSFVGGVIMLRHSIYQSLWIFGILQSVALLGFAELATLPKSFAILAGALTLENFTSGMATAAFLAFIAMQSNKRFSATQFALFNSVVSLPGVFLAGFTGALAVSVGWPLFFIACMLLTLPGLLLLWPLRRLV